MLVYFLNLHRSWTANEAMNRAQIARMLALMRYDVEECETDLKEDGTLPSDVAPSEWYGKYIYITLKENWLSLKEDGNFHPGDPFTYGDLREIMSKFHLSEELLTFSLRYQQDDGMVPRSQWCEVYQYLCADSSKVTRQTLSIHGSPANVSGLNAWQVLTDKGAKQAEGLSVETFMDWETEVYMAGDHLLCVIGKTSKSCKMENVWIESGEGSEIRIFFNGYKRTIKLKNRLNQKLEANMGDLTFTEGQLTSVDYKTSRIKSAITGIEDNTFILKDYGKITGTENLVIYQIYPEPAVISRDKLLADGTVYEFVLEGDKICGIIYQAYTEETIRVLLHGADESYELSSVTVTAEEPFIVIKENQVSRYEGGESVTLVSEDTGGDEIRVRTEADGGKIKILSLERSCGNPSYHGDICLSAYGGGMVVINEVNLESYVAGVIPGEMPISYGTEALKVQAVCARTFGRRALGENFRDYPANLDDTVASQVYNNQLECEESIQAVEATRGQVLQKGDELIATYFFSTSCGHTSDAEDVWYSGGDPEEEDDSLSVFLSDDSVSLELSREEDFRRFINLEDGFNYFEEELPWFRWQVFLSAEEIQENVLNVCQTDIGNLEKITVSDRAESGVLKAVQIEGTKDSCTVYGQYKIRQVLSPENAELIPQSGEAVSGWALLPSAYCYMDPVIEANQCEGYLIHGGGYGHGTGMSQNGAMKMAEMGKDYKEILAYFFPDSSLISE